MTSAWKGSLRSRKEFEKNPGDHVVRYRFAVRFSHGATTLDFGCGDGYGTLFLVTGGSKRVIGFDSDPVAIKRAQRRSHADQVAFLGPDEFRESIDALRGHIDCIVCLEVLEHIPASEQLLTLRELRKLASVDSTLVLSTPNAELDETYHSVGGVSLNPSHLHELSMEELGGLISMSGWRIEEWFAEVPKDRALYGRGLDLIRRVVIRPLSHLAGPKFQFLPYSIRLLLFRMGSLAFLIGTGNRFNQEESWSIVSIKESPLTTAAHLLVVANTRLEP